jgi:hypothetical protein
MSTWFTEFHVWPYFLLGVVAIFSASGFFVTRRTKYLSGVPIAILLGFGVWLIDYLVETDREQVERKTLELAKDAEKGDMDKFMELISKEFAGGTFSSRESLHAEVRKFLPPGQSRKIEFWNLDVKFAAGNQIILSRCNASAGGRFGPFTQEPPHIGVVEFTFRKDADGQWRIRQFRVMDPSGSDVNIPR